MSIFDQMAGAGSPNPAEAEVKVDLRGMERQDALQTLDHIVKYCKKSSAKTLYVKFDPARPGEGETLFQPVARYFKVEKHNGYIAQAVPLMTQEAGGLYVTFKI
ncbi:MAG: hypothetical protein EPN97_08025 [Alphaproteobacteria bacterium]|nr:MAG: hypothetical protein EPN97_08025 [Alphaproteobacteria bacterium]